jgi:hypothetical protein
MLITRTVTKKILENIVHETFCRFGNISSSYLLDSLKLLGFFYATNAGISINIEDLKTPDIKKSFLEAAQNEMVFVSHQWRQGFVSDIERFQSIIDSWNFATESLKNRIIDYYQNFDPANNLYIMAFSGARGNMSQVRQLVGMRGLMSDQEGRIIDLPIQANFREGLSSIDYIISSYGARKGIVDTALKTADSGYLTRRLIYIAQDLILRDIDCFTKKGIIILFNSKTEKKNLTGRVLVSDSSKFGSQILTNELLNFFSNQEKDFILNLRSPLTCRSNGSICQKCYGWDLSKNKLISLGEAVGIIAAQSIGEPGTQLTMRTFHTGGIFTSEMIKQILAPFSGKIMIPKSLKTIAYRTNHGILVKKLLSETTLTITNWKGNQKEIFLEVGSFLYVSSSLFVKKNQLLAEYSAKSGASGSSISGKRRLKPVYTPLSGEIRFESLLVRHVLTKKKKEIAAKVVKVNQENGILWLTSGKILPIPKEAYYKFPTRLDKNKSFSTLKIVSPYEGIAIYNAESQVFSILGLKEKKIIKFSKISTILQNCSFKISIFSKNYQYIDKYTVIGELSIYPKYEGKIYAIRKKESKHTQTLFLISESDIWKVNADQINNFAGSSTVPNKKEKKLFIRSGNFLNSTSIFSKSGIFLKKDGLQMIFQNALPVFLSRGTILNYKQGDFVLEKQIIATLLNYTQQTEDIVQGLPKIEELIEARVPKNKSFLAARPGVILNSKRFIKLAIFKLSENLISYTYKHIDKETLKKEYKKTKKKQAIKIVHRINWERGIIFLFNNQLWKPTLIPAGFRPICLKEKAEFFFQYEKGWESFLDKNKLVESLQENYPNKYKEYRKKIDERIPEAKQKILMIYGNRPSKKWVRENSEKTTSLLNIYKYSDTKNTLWYTRKQNDCLFKDLNGNYIVEISQSFSKEKKQYIFLEPFEPIKEYNFPFNLSILVKPGDFIDLGEPITEGLIDPHELLSILFKYHSSLDGGIEGTLKSLNKFQLLVVHSIQGIYESQGVHISSKHIEIIVRQMTSRVVVMDQGETPLIPGELVRLSLIMEISKAFNFSQSEKKIKYEPLFRSTTNSALSKDGFLSAAGFQETKKILTKAAIEGTTDWLRGLKECVIIGRLIPAGSAFFNYKNYLDDLYFYKDNY